MRNDSAGVTTPRRVTRTGRRAPGARTANVIALPVLAACVVACMVIDISLGPVTVSPGNVLRSVISLVIGSDTTDIPDSAVVTSIRMPRAATAALVGAALAVAGAVMQAVFRNPLADPGIIGVSSGAATAAVLAVTTGVTAVGSWALPAAAFLGALVTVTLVQAVSSLRGGGPATLVLVGVAISAFLGAVTSSAVANAPEESDIRGVTFWLNGDLVARTWSHAGLAVVPVVLCLAVLTVMARDLNILMMGDAAARSTGVDVRIVRGVLLIVASLLTASAVAVSGIIGFVGLVVPHLVRIVLGPDHRLLLPASALTGACFVLLADTVARMLFSPIVLQTGSVVAFLGSPAFLWLLLTTRSTRRFTL
ncbi:iron ABC transporter permease [uncultured Corynebacterium sp.]|uniref:FecCD family ABC transporter permease n=1 Tax=uncultured Corynebacterium sp. TaxID=159447 RepID=UPI0025F04D52|nr:iron ABC transporter permease [uncultured Corynebacterium sp.]